MFFRGITTIGARKKMNQKNGASRMGLPLSSEVWNICISFLLHLRC